MKRMRLTGHIALMGAIRKAYKMLVGMHDGKRPLGRPGCRKEDNIRMHLREKV
jgi:hypothetical protein